MYRLRVKEIIDERKISMGKLSRGADVPLSMVSRICNDKNYNPTMATIRKIADYLGLTMDELYTKDQD
ncbi:MAG: helix-turn-helix transcriptional regulator [Ktedonobacteraceae bacterium]